MIAGIFVRFIILSLFLTAILATSAQVVEIWPTCRTAAVGQQCSLLVMIYKVDRLAGLKIVMKYDE